MGGVIENTNSALRRVPTWSLYILLLLPVPWLLYLAQTGGLGREPINALERELGEIALQLLIAGLCVTPLRDHLGLNLLRFRRMLGVMAFTYVALHLTVWVVLDMSLLWGQMWADILKRPYITIGMAGFVALLPLALTSNNLSVRRMGAAPWRKLHMLTYLAVLLGGVHYLWLVKGIQIEPVAYVAAILALLSLRVAKFARKRAKRVALTGLLSTGLWVSLWVTQDVELRRLSLTLGPRNNASTGALLAQSLYDNTLKFWEKYKIVKKLEYGEKRGCGSDALYLEPPLPERRKRRQRRDYQNTQGGARQRLGRSFGFVCLYVI